MNIITIIIIGIGLSMDAFSLSLAYGTLGIHKKQILILSIIVGLYHFIMPLIGAFVGESIVKMVNIRSNIIIFLILFFIGTNLLIESFKKSKVTSNLKMVDFILFGLAVSLDSFSVGIGLEAITNKHIESSIIFCLLSAFFTGTGLIIGKKTKEIFGQIATFFGGTLLVILSLSYLLK